MSGKRVTTIKIDMILIFDNVFNVHLITPQLGINHTDCKSRQETLINPITHEQNPGYWELSTGEIETFDIDDAISVIHGMIEGKLEMIKNIVDNNKGEIKFDVISCIRENNVPSLVFERNFLELVETLNAELGVYIYIM